MEYLNELLKEKRNLFNINPESFIHASDLLDKGLLLQIYIFAQID